MTGSARLASAVEIARLAEVKPAAVSNWRRRHADFPTAERHGGREVFRVGDVAAWLDNRKVAAKDRRPDEEPGVTYGHRFRRNVGPPGPVSIPANTGERLRRALRDYGMPRGIQGSGLVGLAFALLHLRFHEERRWAELTDAAREGLPAQAAAIIGHALRVGNPTRPSFTSLQSLFERPSDIRQLDSVIQILDRLEPEPETDPNRSAPPAGQVADELLAQFTAAEGRYSGIFFTPRSVVRTAVRLTNPVNGDLIYDPFCRTGEFLVGAADHVRSQGGRPSDLVVSGREVGHDTGWLARMNLALHGIDAHSLHIDGTFYPDRSPHGLFDLILVNPPFNTSNWKSHDLVPDPNWPYGEPPEHNANFAWLQHVLAALAEGGRAAVVMPSGTGSSENPRESAIRAAMVEDGVIDAVVALPPQLFSYTSIPVTLWVLRHPTGSGRDDVLFIDAHAAGTMIGRNHRVLRDEDIARIAEAYHSRLALPSGAILSRPVAREKIRKSGHVLKPGRYLVAATEAVDPERARAEVRDLRRNLRGLYRRSIEAHEEAERQLERVGDLLSDAPAGWRRLPLGEVCDVLAGPSGAVKTEHRPHSGVPIIKPRDITDNRISPKRVDYVEPAVAETLARYRLVPGDIVCTRTGDLGRQALATEEHRAWLISTSCLRLRPDRSVDARYLTYFLNLPQIRQWLFRNASGTTVQSLTAATMRNLPLLLPDRDRQEQIGDVVSALDEQAAMHDEIRRTSSTLRDALLPLFLYDSAFGKGSVDI